MKVFKLLRRWIALRFSYKQALLKVLTELDLNKVNQATEEAWGSYAGRLIKSKTREAIQRYLELVKEDLGLGGRSRK